MFLFACAALAGPTVYLLIRPQARCSAPATDFGSKASAEACADTCASASGCDYFAYSVADGSCVGEATSSQDCLEGFVKDSRWDFYMIASGEPTTGILVELWRTGFLRNVPDVDTLGDPQATYYVEQVDIAGSFMPFVGGTQFVNCFAARFSGQFLAPHTATAEFYTMSDDGSVHAAPTQPTERPPFPATPDQAPLW